MPMVSHYQKGHVTPHFDHHDLGNAVVLLMMLSTSHDVDTNAVALHDTTPMPVAPCDTNTVASGNT